MTEIKELSSMLVEPKPQKSNPSPKDFSAFDLELSRLSGGDISSDEFEKLIDLANAVHRYLLDDSIQQRRDNIIDCRSFGGYYLIDNLLKQNGYFGFLDSGFGSYKQNSLHFALLPGLITALLDPNNTDSTDLKSIQIRSYLPADIEFTPESIRDILIRISPYFTEKVCGTESENGFYKKLVSWATADCSPWCELTEDSSISLIAALTEKTSDFIVENTYISIEEIMSMLSGLQAIRVEKGSRTFSLISRINPQIYSIFYCLDLPTPPLVLHETTDRLVKSTKGFSQDGRIYNSKLVGAVNVI